MKDNDVTAFEQICENISTKVTKTFNEDFQFAFDFGNVSQKRQFFEEVY